VHLLGRVAGDAQQGVRPEQLPGDLGVHGVEAQVDAFGADRERHVGAAVHDHLERAPGACRGLARRAGRRLGEGQQLRAAQPALADLHPVDPAGHRGGHALHQISPRRRAIQHQAEDRCAPVAQKSAIPSRGLEAEA
jgi:hypothetical protein